MTPEYPAETAEFRKGIQAFLAANLPEGWTGLGGIPTDDVLPFLEQWRKVLHESRLLAPQWPAEYGGGGLSNLETVIQFEEFAKVGAPTGGPNDVFNIGMIGNTILHWGTPSEAHYYKLLSNSTSGARATASRTPAPTSPGSAAGRARRRRVRHRGQKIWTTYDHLANHISWSVTDTTGPPPRHHVPAGRHGPARRQVRPIKMMSGDSEFNEVFFTDVRCPKENIRASPTRLGHRDDPARVRAGRGRRRAADPLPRELDARGDGQDRSQHRPARSSAHRLVLQQVESCGTSACAPSRCSWPARTGPDVHASSGRVPQGRTSSRSTSWARQPGAVGRWPSTRSRATTGSPNDSASWVGTMYTAMGGTIYAGTSQIQRNIIGERILGLPKEPSGR